MKKKALILGIVSVLLSVILASTISSLGDTTYLNKTIHSIPREWSGLDADKAVKYDASKVDLAVIELNFRLRNEIAEPEMSTAQLATLPAGITSFDGDVYSYLSVDTEKMSDEDLMYMDITFKVQKRWLGENNRANEDIVLYYYLDGEWLPLTTRVHALVDTYVMYKSTSFNFGTFAVSFRQVEKTDSGSDIEAVETTKADAPKISPIKTPKIIVEKPKPAPKTESLRGVSVFLIIVILLIYYYYIRDMSGKRVTKNKRKNKNR